MSAYITEFPLPEEQLAFAAGHAGDDPARLRLKYGREYSAAITQIECRRRFGKKLGGFISAGLEFPSLLAAEQASDEKVADYNAHILIDRPDPCALDLTAGLGIDSMSAARMGAKVLALELDAEKAACLRGNVARIVPGMMDVVNADCLEWLSANTRRFDALFVDPARRGEGGGRLYRMEDCQPDIVTNWKLLAGAAPRIVVKASPMLDIHSVARSLPGLMELHIVVCHGECKEVLAVCDGERTALTDDNEIDVICADLDNGSRFATTLLMCGGNSYSYAGADDVMIGSWLYEPNAALMKAAPWSILMCRYPGLKKIGPSTHLFVSDEEITDFPGRRWKIRGFVKSQELKKLKGKRCNVVCRNHPLSAAQLERKAGVIPGDDAWLIGFRLGSTPVIVES